MEKYLSPSVAEPKATSTLDRGTNGKANQLRGPVPHTINPETYVTTLAKFIYLWAWPMTNIHNRYLMFAQLKEPTYGGGVLPIVPPTSMCMLTDYVKPEERAVACSNQDVIYGMGCLDFRREPVVLQVPDFGDRFGVYQICDQRTDGFANVRKMYDTKPGFYLLTGMEWKGKTPDGISGVFKCPTTLGIITPRVFQSDDAADKKKIQALISQIIMYPLSEFDGKMKNTEWTSLKFTPPNTSGGAETKWVKPGTFFDQLPGKLKEVPAQAGEETLSTQFNELPECISKNPNFVNKPNETTYIYQDRDASGARLDGNNQYTVTFAKGQLPPVKGFWSLTLYYKEHFFSPNELNRYSLGTKNKDLQFEADGSLTLYVQSTPPDESKKSNWLPAPNEAFSLYIRCYWPDESMVAEKWMPPSVVKK